MSAALAMTATRWDRLRPSQHHGAVPDRDAGTISAMFRHVVLMEFDPTAPPGHLDELTARLRELPDQLPSLRSYVIGRDLSLAPGNAHLAVIAEFDDIDGYVEYRDHPSHRRIVDEMIAPHLRRRLASQFDDSSAI